MCWKVTFQGVLLIYHWFLSICDPRSLARHPVIDQLSSRTTDSFICHVKTGMLSTLNNVACDSSSCSLASHSVLEGNC